jgi:hypothetical protein
VYSCKDAKPSAPIQRDTFVQIYTGMLLIDELAKVNKTDPYTARIELFRRYHVDSVRVFSTLAHYAKDAEAMQSIYEDAIRMLEARLKIKPVAQH